MPLKRPSRWALLIQNRLAVSTKESTNSQVSNSSSLNSQLSNIVMTSRGVDLRPPAYSRLDHTLVICRAL